MLKSPALTSVLRWRPNVPPLVLASLTVLLLIGLVTPPDQRQIPDTTMPAGEGDLALFGAVATRMTDGEAYYSAMRDELVGRGYPTGSVANWRTPLHLELVAHAPLALRGLLVLVSILVLVGTAWVLRPLATGALVMGLLLQNGVVAALWLGTLVVMPEPLTGGLIALSVLASLRNWRGTGVLLGTSALFVRELAVPYVGVRLAYAIWTQQWREAIGWCLGLSVYGMYLLWHVAQVYHAMPPNPTWHPTPWIEFGGLRFVLATVRRSNLWLTGLPWWMTPFALVAALLGMWKAPPVLSVSVLVYFVIFAIVGHTFNFYWGWVPGMLLPLVWAHIWDDTPPPTKALHS